MNQPLGYETWPIARRVTRPLHRREAVLKEAEAAFKPKLDDEKKPTTDNQNSSRLLDNSHGIIERGESKCPTKN